MSFRTLLTVFIVSLVTLIGVTAVLVGGRESDGGAGESQVFEDLLSGTATTPGPSVSTTSTTTETGAPGETTDPPGPTVPVESGVFSAGPTPDRVVPTGLRLPAIGVDAPVIPTGVDARTGQMEVPNNVSDVAWYEFGPRPGESGSAVLAAHVDLAGQGPGVFFKLREINPGDVIVVSFSDGSSAPFRVEARTVYKKDELPVDVIFSRQGPPVLTLVTCGGGFSASSRSYDSNVVVYAVPVESESGDGAQ